MRKALVIALSILLSSALCASSVTFDSSVPDDIAAVIDDGIRRWTEGRGDIQVEVGGYSEDDTLFEGRIFAYFTASSGGSSYDIRAVGEGREGLEEAIADEVRNILFYEESFMSPSPRLDYIYRGSYSFLSDSYYRRGTRLSAVDGDGRIRGLFEVAERYDGSVLLEPVYLSDPVPGLGIKEYGEWTASVSASMGFDFPDPAFEVTAAIGRSDLLYPFTPFLSFTYMMDNGSSFMYGGIGLSASLDFWRIFPTVSFTLIEEGRIGADAAILLGMGPDGFDWCGRYSVYYEHSPLPSFFWRLGYVNIQGRHMLMLGGGGRF